MEALQSGSDKPLKLFLTKSSVEPIVNWQLLTGATDDPKVIYNRDGELPTELVIDKRNPELLKQQGYQNWWIKALTSNNTTLASNPVYLKHDSDPPQISFDVNTTSEDFLKNNLKFIFHSFPKDASDIKGYDLTIYFIEKKRTLFCA